MGSSDLARAVRTRDLATDVLRFPTLFANLYIVGTHERFALIDTGLPGFADSIKRSVERRFGPGAKPEAILLTHGHWDHAGCALGLSEHWDAPMFAHELELPYLTGKSNYAPKDPTVGGAISFASRLMPTKAYNFGQRVQALPSNGTVPGLPDWYWLHTPGHTHGHVSFFRERDSLLLAGDALTTVNQDNPYTAVTRRPEFYRPPAPFTVDWDAAGSSICTLADLAPDVVGAGHGWPMKGPNTAMLLHHFAREFQRPSHGRYADTPAKADGTGIVSVPPPVPDPTGKAMAIWAVTGVGGLAAYLIAHQMKRRYDKRKKSAELPS